MLGRKIQEDVQKKRCDSKTQSALKECYEVQNEYVDEKRRKRRRKS